jgi:hypothetical protein
MELQADDVANRVAARLWHDRVDAQEPDYTHHALPRTSIVSL